MAFCTQCGAQLPESGKFCPNCGASINADMLLESTVSAEGTDDLIPVAPPVPIQQQITCEMTDTNTKKKKPRRTIGTLFSLASFVLAILALLSGSLVLSIVFAVAAIAAGVFAFIKKGRLKAFVIIAFLIAAFALVDTVWYIVTGEIMIAPSKTEISFDQTQKVTEGGITFELPTGYTKESANGSSAYYYGEDVAVVLGSTITDYIDLRNAIETLSLDLLTNRKTIRNEDATIASFESRVAEYTGEYNGMQCYSEMAGIKNTDNSSFVFCVVLCTEDDQEQGQKLFDNLISSATSTSIATKSTGNTTAPATGRTSQPAAAGVDPDLAAFLSSYESFIDEYVAFMEKYMSDPSNMVSMLGDYLEMTEKLEDLSEQADRYDPDDMSVADSKYYLEVMTRCEMKLLDAMG